MYFRLYSALCCLSEKVDVKLDLAADFTWHYELHYEYFTHLLLTPDEKHPVINIAGTLHDRWGNEKCWTQQPKMPQPDQTGLKLQPALQQM